MHKPSFWIATLLLLLGVHRALGDDVILGARQYSLTTNMFIASGETLTILAGVTINGNGFRIEAAGGAKLIAEGTSDAFINFNDLTIHQTTSGLFVATLQYVNMSGGAIGMASTELGPWALRLDARHCDFRDASENYNFDSAVLNIAQSRFRNSKQWLMRSVQAQIEHNVFLDEGSSSSGTTEALFQITGSESVFNNQIVFINNAFLTVGKLYFSVDSSAVVSDISITNNYWGTEDTARIDAMILDGRDESWRGALVYTPIETGLSDLTPRFCTPLNCSGNGNGAPVPGVYACQCACNEGFSGTVCDVCNIENCTGVTPAPPTPAPPTPAPTTAVACTDRANCNGKAVSVSGTVGAGCTCLCAHPYGGASCETCVSGYEDYPNCTYAGCTAAGYCNNHGNASLGYGGFSSTGCVCSCSTRFAGSVCDACAAGYENYPTCSYIACTSAANCNNRAALVTGDIVNGCFCNCEDGYGGLDCSETRPITPTLPMTHSNSLSITTTASLKPIQCITTVCGTTSVQRIPAVDIAFIGDRRTAPLATLGTQLNSSIHDILPVTGTVLPVFRNSKASVLLSNNVEATPSDIANSWAFDARSVAVDTTIRVYVGANVESPLLEPRMHFFVSGFPQGRSLLDAVLGNENVTEVLPAPDVWSWTQNIFVQPNTQNDITSQLRPIFPNPLVFEAAIVVGYKFFVKARTSVVGSTLVLTSSDTLTHTCILQLHQMVDTSTTSSWNQSSCQSAILVCDINFDVLAVPRPTLDAPFTLLRFPVGDINQVCPSEQTSSGFNFDVTVSYIQGMASAAALLAASDSTTKNTPQGSVSAAVELTSSWGRKDASFSRSWAELIILLCIGFVVLLLTLWKFIGEKVGLLKLTEEEKKIDEFTWFSISYGVGFALSAAVFVYLIQSSVSEFQPDITTSHPIVLQMFRSAQCTNSTLNPFPSRVLYSETDFERCKNTMTTMGSVDGGLLRFAGVCKALGNAFVIDDLVLAPTTTECMSQRPLDNVPTGVCLPASSIYPGLPYHIVLNCVHRDALDGYKKVAAATFNTYNATANTTVSIAGDVAPWQGFSAGVSYSPFHFQDQAFNATAFFLTAGNDDKHASTRIAAVFSEQDIYDLRSRNSDLLSHLVFDITTAEHALPRALRSKGAVTSFEGSDLSRYGLHFNFPYTANRHAFVSAKSAGYGAQRYYGMRGSPFDIGSFEKTKDITLMFWMKGSRTTRGFPIIIVDNLFDTNNFDSPITNRFEEHLLNKESNAKWFQDNFHVYAAVHVDGSSKTVRFAYKYPENVRGGEQLHLLWGPEVVGQMFDSNWHFVVIKRVTVGSDTTVILYIDGNTGYHDITYQKCVPKSYEFPPIQDFNDTHPVEHDAKDTLVKDGVMYIGNLNGGVWGVQVVHGALSHVQIVALGPDKVKPNVYQSRAGGLVFVVLFGIGAVATILELLRRIQQGKCSESNEELDEELLEREAVGEYDDNPTKAGNENHEPFDEEVGVNDDSGDEQMNMSKGMRKSNSRGLDLGASASKRKEREDKQIDAKGAGFGAKSAASAAKSAAAAKQGILSASAAGSSTRAVPLILTVTQHMTMLMVSFEFPDNFLNFKWIVAPFSLELNLMFPTVSFLAMSLVQLTAPFVVFALVVIFMSQDQKKFRNEINKLANGIFHKKEEDIEKEIQSRPIPIVHFYIDATAQNGEGLQAESTSWLTKAGAGDSDCSDDDLLKAQAQSSAHFPLLGGLNILDADEGEDEEDGEGGEKEVYDRFSNKMALMDPSGKLAKYVEKQLEQVAILFDEQKAQFLKTEQERRGQSPSTLLHDQTKMQLEVVGEEKMQIHTEVFDIRRAFVLKTDLKSIVGMVKSRSLRDEVWKDYRETEMLTPDDLPDDLGEKLRKPAKLVELIKYWKIGNDLFLRKGNSRFATGISHTNKSKPSAINEDEIYSEIEIFSYLFKRMGYSLIDDTPLLEFFWRQTKHKYQQYDNSNDQQREDESAPMSESATQWSSAAPWTPGELSSSMGAGSIHSRLSRLQLGKDSPTEHCAARIRTEEVLQQLGEARERLQVMYDDIQVSSGDRADQESLVQNLEHELHLLQKIHLYDISMSKGNKRNDDDDLLLSLSDFFCLYQLVDDFYGTFMCVNEVVGHEFYPKSMKSLLVSPESEASVQLMTQIEATANELFQSTNFPGLYPKVGRLCFTKERKFEITENSTWMMFPVHDAKDLEKVISTTQEELHERAAFFDSICQTPHKKFRAYRALYIVSTVEQLQLSELVGFSQWHRKHEIDAGKKDLTDPVERARFFTTAVLDEYNDHIGKGGKKQVYTPHFRGCREGTIITELPVGDFPPPKVFFQDVIQYNPTVTRDEITYNVNIKASNNCPACNIPLIPQFHELHHAKRWVKIHKDDKEMVDRFSCRLANTSVCQFVRNAYPAENDNGLPCSPEPSEFFVCPNDCGFAACKFCLPPPSTVDGFKDLIRQRLYYWKVSGFFATLGQGVLLAIQFVYLPALRSALAIVACHYSLQCEFPTCYSPPEPGFLLLSGMGCFVVFFLCVGFIGFTARIIYDRKAALLRARNESTGEMLLPDSELLGKVFPFNFLLEKKCNRESVLHVISARCTKNLWAEILEKDATVFRGLYDVFNFGAMLAQPIILLFTCLFVICTLFGGPPNSLAQLVFTGCIETMQCLFFLLTNPFSELKMNMLARIGGLHQVIQVGLMALYRADVQEDIHKVDTSYVMIAFAAAYLLYAAFTIAQTAVLPILRKKWEQDALKESAAEKSAEQGTQKERAEKNTPEQLSIVKAINKKRHVETRRVAAARRRELCLSIVDKAEESVAVLIEELDQREKNAAAASASLSSTAPVHQQQHLTEQAIDSVHDWLMQSQEFMNHLCARCKDLHNLHKSAGKFDAVADDDMIEKLYSNTGDEQGEEGADWDKMEEVSSGKRREKKKTPSEIRHEERAINHLIRQELADDAQRLVQQFNRLERSLGAALGLRKELWLQLVASTQQSSSRMFEKMCEMTREEFISHMNTLTRSNSSPQTQQITNKKIVSNFYAAQHRSLLRFCLLRNRLCLQLEDMRKHQAQRAEFQQAHFAKQYLQLFSGIDTVLQQMGPPRDEISSPSKHSTAPAPRNRNVWGEFSHHEKHHEPLYEEVTERILSCIRFQDISGFTSSETAGSWAEPIARLCREALQTPPLESNAAELHQPDVFFSSSGEAVEVLSPAGTNSTVPNDSLQQQERSRAFVCMQHAYSFHPAIGQLFQEYFLGYFHGWIQHADAAFAKIGEAAVERIRDELESLPLDPPAARASEDVDDENPSSSDGPIPRAASMFEVSINKLLDTLAPSEMDYFTFNVAFVVEEKCAPPPPRYRQSVGQLVAAARETLEKARAQRRKEESYFAEQISDLCSVYLRDVVANLQTQGRTQRDAIAQKLEKGEFQTEEERKSLIMAAENIERTHFPSSEALDLDALLPQHLLSRFDEESKQRLLVNLEAVKNNNEQTKRHSHEAARLKEATKKSASAMAARTASQEVLSEDEDKRTVQKAPQPRSQQRTSARVTDQKDSLETPQALETSAKKRSGAVEKDPVQQQEARTNATQQNPQPPSWAPRSAALSETCQKAMNENAASLTPSTRPLPTTAASPSDTQRMHLVYAHANATIAEMGAALISATEAASLTGPRAHAPQEVIGSLGALEASMLKDLKNTIAIVFQQFTDVFHRNSEASKSNRSPIRSSRSNLQRFSPSLDSHLLELARFAIEVEQRSSASGSVVGETWYAQKEECRQGCGSLSLYALLLAGYAEEIHNYAEVQQPCVKELGNLVARATQFTRGIIPEGEEVEPHVHSTLQSIERKVSLLERETELILSPMFLSILAAEVEIVATFTQGALCTRGNSGNALEANHLADELRDLYSEVLQGESEYAPVVELDLAWHKRVAPLLHQELADLIDHNTPGFSKQQRAKLKSKLRPLERFPHEGFSEKVDRTSASVSNRASLAQILTVGLPVFEETAVFDEEDE